MFWRRKLSLRKGKCLPCPLGVSALVLAVRFGTEERLGWIQPFPH
jgi:hypothetical protein